MPQFMLLLHGDDNPDMSPEEMQRIVGEYVAWSRDMAARGLLKDGAELAPGGKIVRGVGPSAVVMDGPFAEAKESIGGYFLIEAKDEDEAIAVCKECPGLRRGGAVQLRELVEH